MNELDIEKLNNEIGYEEGKIYWDWCKGHTSDLVKRLSKNDYTIVKSGAIYILNDEEKNEVTTGYSWEGLLYNIAKVMK